MCKTNTWSVPGGTLLSEKCSLWYPQQIVTYPNPYFFGIFEQCFFKVLSFCDFLRYFSQAVRVGFSSSQNLRYWMVIFMFLERVYAIPTLVFSYNITSIENSALEFIIIWILRLSLNLIFITLIIKTLNQTIFSVLLVEYLIHCCLANSLWLLRKKKPNN